MKHIMQMMLSFLLIPPLLLTVSAQQKYTIGQHVFGSGSLDVSSLQYSVNSTLAQTAIGPVLGPSIGVKHEMFAGFWYTIDSLSTITIAERIDDIPAASELLQNYPNPCVGTTTIPFSLNTNGSANLSVYDLLGNVVATLIDGDLSPGSYRAQFTPGASLAEGIYVYRLEVSPDSRSDRTKPFVRIRWLLLMR